MRIADLLVVQGLVEFIPNPANLTANLLRPTAEGRSAESRISPAHADLVQRLTDEPGPKDLVTTLRILTRRSETMQAITSLE